MPSTSSLTNLDDHNIDDLYNMDTLSTVETADRDSMLNKIVWANRIVRFRARLYHCGDPLYKVGR